MRLARLLRLPIRRSAPKSCRCGHAANAHEHYRRGTDCAMCSCPKFRAGSAAKAPAQRDDSAERDNRGERAHAA